MKSFYQPVVMIALGVVVGLLLFSTDKKNLNQAADAKPELKLPVILESKPSTNTDDEEIVFKCKKETAAKSVEADKLELLPFKANE